MRPLLHGARTETSSCIRTSMVDLSCSPGAGWISEPVVTGSFRSALHRRGPHGKGRFHYAVRIFGGSISPGNACRYSRRHSCNPQAWAARATPSHRTWLCARMVSGRQMAVLCSEQTRWKPRIPNSDQDLRDNHLSHHPCAPLWSVTPSVSASLVLDSSPFGG